MRRRGAIRRFLRRRRFRLLIGLAVVAAAASAASAWAYWTASASSGSAGAAAAATVGQGATPSIAITGGRTITVTWGKSMLSNGVDAAGYVVTRYDATTGVPQLVQPGWGCSGIVPGSGTTISCTDIGVLPGSWQYTVTPVIGNWRGPESAKSGVVTISAAALDVSPTVFNNAAFTPTFANATGSITGFAQTEGVSYRLDSSTTLTGSPTSVDHDGNATISALAIPRTAGDGGHTVYALGDLSPYPSQAGAAILIDTKPPVVSSSLSPTANGAGWNNASPVSVSLTADDNGGSGVAAVRYTTDGTDPTTSATATTYTGPFNVSAQGTATVEYYATDVAGNASAVQTQLVKIDTVPPTNSLSLNVTSGNAFLNGTTLWYRGVAAGSFTITNAVADSLSGPASSGFAPLDGAAGGWSFTSSSVNAPAGGPYTSNAFSWAAGTTSSPSETVAGFDAADNLTPASPLTFTNDSTGPSGGSISVNGLGGTGAAYSTSTTLSLSLNAGTDAGVGNAAASTFALLRASAPLTSNGTSDGSCGTFGSYSNIATGPGSSYTDTAAGGISASNCFEYEYVVSDLLGNTTTYTSNVVKVDTTAPSTPASIALTPVTGLSYQSVSGNTLWYNPAQAGSFTLDSSASDGESGIAQMLFPTMSGFGGGGAVSSPNSGTTFRATYSWNNNGGSASPGKQTISSSDNAGLSATKGNAFTLTKDDTAPTTSDNATSGWKKTSVTVTLTPSDNSGGSGVANTYYTTDGSTPVVGSASGTTISLTTDGIYPIKYFSVDRVGNRESVETGNTVMIDETQPTAPVVVPGGNTYTSGGGTIYVRNGVSLTDVASDPIVNTASSGVASVQYLYCSGAGCTPGTSIGTVTSGTNYPFSWNSQPADGTYRLAAKVTDNAGNTATSTPVTVVIDNSKPNTTDNTGTIGNAWKKTNQTVTLNPTDAGSGVAGTYYTTGSPTAATPTTSSSTGTSVSLTGDGLWQVKYFSVDNVGNQESVETSVTTIRIDETAPNAGTVATGGAYVNGGTTYVANGQALTDTTTGDPTVNGAASGVATVQYFYCSSGCGGTTPGSNPGSWTSIGTASSGSYSVAWNSQPADGTYSLDAKVTDNAANTSYSALSTVFVDNTAPTNSFNLSPTPNGAGWNKANVTITLSGNDNGGSGVSSMTYSATGATTIATTTAAGNNIPVTISNEGTTSITYHANDNVGNSQTNGSITIKLDKTSPTVSIASITAGGTTACEYVNGTSAWYSTTGTGNSCGTATGSFTVNATASDTGGSGVNDVLFPDFTAFGFAGGGDVAAPGPYSRTYTWTNVTGGSPSGNVTATDVAANTKTAAFSFTLDNGAPTGNIATPAAGTIQGTAVSLTSSSVADNTGGSGVKSVAYYDCSGTCSTSPPAAGWTLIGTSTTGSSYSVNWDTTQVANGSYTLKSLVTDNVGNQGASAGVAVTVSNTYSFVIGSLSSQQAGTGFGGFTVQLQLNGANTATYKGAAYGSSGGTSHAITFGGSATANSPNNTAASGLTQNLSFNASGQATAGSITLYDAVGNGTFTATDATNSITGSTALTVSAAPVQLSFTVACPASLAKGGVGTYSTGVSRAAADAYGNADPNKGSSMTVSLGATTKGTWSPASLSIAANGTTSGSTATYTTGTGVYSTTLSASAAGYVSTTCTVSVS